MRSSHELSKSVVSFELQIIRVNIETSKIVNYDFDSQPRSQFAVFFIDNGYFFKEYSIGNRYCSHQR